MSYSISQTPPSIDAFGDWHPQNLLPLEWIGVAATASVTILLLYS